MFHIVTVHWRIDSWIEPQLRYVHRHFPPDTRVYASLNGIDPTHRAAFDFADDLAGTHAEKLNQLARIVSEQADPGDHLVFIDGDAFPIAPIGAELLAGRPLAAVRRDENLGDPQPHPCFCMTTVGFWNEIEGDWRGGYTWKNSLGYRTSDVGGNLLGILRRRNLDWLPLLRTNRVDLHPLWFAIYGDVVYHQGAGFRASVARSTINMRRARVPTWVPWLRRIDRDRAMRDAMERRKNEMPNPADRALADRMLAMIRSDSDFTAELLAT